MGPPPMNFAADAHGCIMVRSRKGLPNTRLWRGDPRPMAGSTSDCHEASSLSVFAGDHPAHALTTAKTKAKKQEFHGASFESLTK